MLKEPYTSKKNELRAYFKMLRKNLSLFRRKEAAEALFKHLPKKIAIFSFASMGTEINLSKVNTLLKQENRLTLPLMQEDQIIPSNENPYQLIFVPALAFDRSGARLGYGKGHFDRFLAKHPPIRTIGVGFREQLSKEPLPQDPWDLKVDELWLF